MWMYRFGGFPGPMKTVDKSCSSLCAYLMACTISWPVWKGWLGLSAGEVAVFEKAHFLTKQRPSSPKLFLYM